MHIQHTHSSSALAIDFFSSTGGNRLHLYDILYIFVLRIRCGCPSKVCVCVWLYANWMRYATLNTSSSDKSLAMLRFSLATGNLQPAMGIDSGSGDDDSMVCCTSGWCWYHITSLFCCWYSKLSMLSIQPLSYLLSYLSLSLIEFDRRLRT